MCFKTVSPGGNTYLHPSLLLLLLHGIMGPFRFVLLNRKVAPACYSVDIENDIQRLYFGVSPYFCLGLTGVNYKVDTVYLQKHKLILITQFYVCLCVQEIPAFVSVNLIQLDVRNECDSLTLRLLMSYIYIYIYIYMEHPFLMFLDYTQRRSTVGRTPLDE